MNINQLEYFITTAELLNFTKAAEACFISQTAMTQQIKALEKTLGVPLFFRDKHHVELTPAGRVYLAEARAIVNRSNEAMKLARLASTGVEGDLTIGFIRGYGSADFPKLLKKFHAAYPGIRVHLLRGNSSVLLERLQTGDCDLVLTISPFVRTHPEFSFRYLKSYPVMAVLASGHPLADRQKLTYKDLEHEPFIMMQPSNRPKDQMEESTLIYQRGGYFPQVAEVEGDPETLLLMISAGMGISLLPEYITRSCSGNPDLRVIPMIKTDGSAETLDFEAAWPKNTINPAVAEFLEIL